jgi:cold shock CspA family protein
MVGRIKYINAKFFGFIWPNDGGPNIWFHAIELVDFVFNNALVGELVEYEVAVDGEGRLQATNVRPYETTAP